MKKKKKIKNNRCEINKTQNKPHFFRSHISYEGF